MAAAAATERGILARHFDSQSLRAKKTSDAASVTRRGGTLSRIAAVARLSSFE
jgi:hypothetical protein